MLTLCTSAAALDSADITIANSYDDAWEYAWASTMRSVHTDASLPAPRAVKVIHVGDSMTFSSGAPDTSWDDYRYFHESLRDLLTKYGG